MHESPASIALRIEESADPEWIQEQYRTGNPELHCAVAENIHTPASILAILAESDSSWVRRRVAANPSARELTVRGLLDDEDLEVATAAEVALNG